MITSEWSTLEIILLCLLTVGGLILSLKVFHFTKTSKEEDERLKKERKKEKEQLNQQIHSIAKERLNTDSQNILIRPDQSARLKENLNEKGYVLTCNKTDYYLGVLKDGEDIKVTKWVELSGLNLHKTND